MELQKLSFDQQPFFAFFFFFFGDEANEGNTLNYNPQKRRNIKRKHEQGLTDLNEVHVKGKHLPKVAAKPIYLFFSYIKRTFIFI